jgi:hypothetical protein
VQDVIYICNYLNLKWYIIEHWPKDVLLKNIFQDSKNTGTNGWFIVADEKYSLLWLLTNYLCKLHTEQYYYA